MKISVVTIAYNAGDVIERTIRSVVAQTYDDMEYVLVDGGSNDGTLSIIKRYASRIDKWVSEPDSGIYEAMNKGVKMSSGEFCIFMNAGDMFFGDNVLKAVAPLLDRRYSIIMGNQIVLSHEGRFLSYSRHWEKFNKNKLFFDSIHHQASFIRRADMIEHPYDESYRMVSDWKLALDLIGSSPEKYIGIDVDVSLFFRDGISETHYEYGRNERESIIPLYFSQSEQEENISAFKSYKRLTNIGRYFNFIQRVAYQTMKCLQLSCVVRKRLKETR